MPLIPASLRIATLGLFLAVDPLHAQPGAPPASLDGYYLRLDRLPDADGRHVWLRTAEAPAEAGHFFHVQGDVLTEVSTSSGRDGDAYISNRAEFSRALGLLHLEEGEWLMAGLDEQKLPLHLHLAGDTLHTQPFAKWSHRWPLDAEGAWPLNGTSQAQMAAFVKHLSAYQARLACWTEGAVPARQRKALARQWEAHGLPPGGFDANPRHTRPRQAPCLVIFIEVLGS